MEFSKQTKQRMQKYSDLGYRIIIGNNRDLPKRKKWQGHECVRLCLTNSKTHGFPIRTVWAVRPIGGE
jgi:hypothetical protein